MTHTGTEKRRRGHAIDPHAMEMFLATRMTNCKYGMKQKGHGMLLRWPHIKVHVAIRTSRVGVFTTLEFDILVSKACRVQLAANTSIQLAANTSTSSVS